MYMDLLSSLMNLQKLPQLMPGGSGGQTSVNIGSFGSAPADFMSSLAAPSQTQTTSPFQAVANTGTPGASAGSFWDMMAPSGYQATQYAPMNQKQSAQDFFAPQQKEKAQQFAPLTPWNKNTHYGPFNPHKPY